MVFGSSLVPMVTVLDTPVMFAQLSVVAILQTLARREYRNARHLEGTETAVMRRDHARLGSVVIRGFRNASTCLVVMVNRV